MRRALLQDLASLLMLATMDEHPRKDIAARDPGEIVRVGRHALQLRQ
jgi:hypothetical protein